MNEDKETVRSLLLSYLREVMSEESSKLVGKIMKRFELFEDRELLKKEIKELVYENARELQNIFEAYSRGVEKSYFQFAQSKGN